jgi:hypothetical protein
VRGEFELATLDLPSGIVTVQHADDRLPARP